MDEPKNVIKILFTGGHHTPAFAVLEELQRQFSIFNFQFSIVWVGHKFSMTGDRSESLEHKEVAALGIKFIDFKTPRFHRQGRLFFGFKFFWAVLEALKILVSNRPRAVLSFGGYLSSPIVFAASLLRIPAITHEQTSAAGFANRFNARFCRQVLLSFESSRRYFPAGKTVLTGDPIRSEVFEDRGSFKFNNDQPTIYVTGGQQGSHTINRTILKILSSLLRRYNVIHQAGSSTVFNDHQVLAAAVSVWPDVLRRKYLLRDHFGASEIGSVLARADLVVSRAGANTVTELAVLRKKSILIPLPGSSHAEQQGNARLLKSLGLAEIIDEGRLTGEVLLTLIERNLSESKTPVNEEEIERLFPRDGADRVAHEILKVLNLTS